LQHHILYLKLDSIAPLSVAAKDSLLQIAAIKQVSRKEYLLQEGEICKTIFFVEKGYLRTYYNKDGKEINLNFTLEGSFVTNLKSMRTQEPSDYIIEAGEESVVWMFDRTQLLALYDTSIEITHFGRNLLEHLLSEQEQQTDLFKLQSPTERYENLIKHQPELLQKISLSQLSSYLGISRETLSRIRNK
jgi:CRP-like cAMP-binding protein